MSCDTVPVMTSTRGLLAIALLSVGLSPSIFMAQFPPSAFERAQIPPSPPDFSGTWMLVEGDLSSNSPLGQEGSISQEGSALVFRTSSQSLKVPFDGSRTTRSAPAFNWEYEGRWEGFVAVVSMKATSGGTPGNFVDLMLVSPGGGETLTIVMFRTTKGPGKVMHTDVLTYRKRN